MNRYTVEYYAGTYEGKRTVIAEDRETAIRKVRAEIRKLMTLPMYSDGYKVISCEPMYEAHYDEQE